VKKIQIRSRIIQNSISPSTWIKIDEIHLQNIPLIIGFPTVPRTCPNFFSSPENFVQYSITLAWYV
jgi:hypothetical protein